MFKFSGFIIGGALLFLAGCTAPAPEPVPQEWSITNPQPKGAGATNVASLGINQPPRLTVPVKTLPLVRTNTAVTNMVRPAPMTTWTSVDSWAAAHHLAQPQRLASSPMATYALTSGNGELVFAIGSRYASWNNREVSLGFEPEMIDGEVVMHALDLQKNAEPLLCEKPLTFGNDHVIVLDPGHGGMNSGTISVLDHRPEKEFTLDLAKRLKPLLEEEGWKVFLTRTDDYDLALSNRVALAEEHRADLFISLHFNSSAPDKKQSGLETYCLTPMGMPSTVTRDFADPWSENLPNNNFDAQNLQLAARLHNALLRTDGENDRGVRRVRFSGVLRGQNRPAILIEGGYLSNPVEAAKIESPEFRQRMAETIAEALLRNPPAATPKPAMVTAQAHTNSVP